MYYELRIKFYTCDIYPLIKTCKMKPTSPPPHTDTSTHIHTVISKFSESMPRHRAVFLGRGQDHEAVLQEKRECAPERKQKGGKRIGVELRTLGFFAKREMSKTKFQVINVVAI